MRQGDVYFCQNDGYSRTSAENISSRPTSMLNERNHFPALEMCAKFSVGPTSPKPGPMFISVAITELSALVASMPSTIDMNRPPAATMNIFTMK